ncbi:hypothetical protein LAUMK4_00132 [Mycobacterium persicum]|uniref:Uncharacterized protein n=1 Tax=Mycobacterium persicum TaxID=1487726 RepID=A0ABY6RBI4_9MYCO|nr:hypothetical protein LAUMK15_00482 [Mycobacterium persicum]VAZ86899.1 hypothetical protein LAUMK4_00132 [Mycobacterium persicum]
MRHQESRSGDHTGGASRQGRAGVGAVRDAPGEQHRPRPGHRQSLREEVQCRHGPDEVSTGFTALGDQPVSAAGDRAQRLFPGADHHEDDDSGVAKMLDEPALLAEGQNDDVHPRADTHVDVTAVQEGQQQVDCHGSARSLGPHSIDGPAQLTSGDQAEGAQTARVGDRRRQRCAGDAAAHACLGHRNVESQPVEDINHRKPSDLALRRSGHRQMVWPSSPSAPMLPGPPSVPPGGVP